MMNCRSVRKMLSAYQDGELGAKERDLIEAHLEKCRACGKYYEELQATWAFLGWLPDIEPGERFYLEVRKKISSLRDQRLASRCRRILQLLPSPVAMTVLLVAGLLIGAYLGNFLSKDGLTSFTSHQPGYSRGGLSLTSFRSFDPIPPGTLAHGYMRLVSYTKGRDR